MIRLVKKQLTYSFIKKDDNSHYSLIKNFNRLVDLQVSKNTDIKNTFVKDVFNIIQNQNYFKNISNFVPLIET